MVSRRGAVDGAPRRARCRTRHYLDKSLFCVRRPSHLRTIYTSDRLHARESKLWLAVAVTEMREAGVPLKQVGRYTIFDQIGAGGMATVHLARLAGPAGVSRGVAGKHPLPPPPPVTAIRGPILPAARPAPRRRPAYG